MSDLSGTAGFRRVALTLAVYAVVAGILWWLTPAFQRLLLLPMLFPRVARGALLLGAPLAGVLAWRYPSLGVSDREE